jgi:hypothetical protein
MGEAAMRAKNGGSSCCGASPPSVNVDPITSDLYLNQEREGCLPMGCRFSWSWK